MSRESYLVMRTKQYKVGDRIFFTDFSGAVRSAIVIDVEPCSYKNDSGKYVHYKRLITWREGGCSQGIEDYNCLSPRHPACREYAKRFAKFDKQKDGIINSIVDILSPWGEAIQEEILDLIKAKLDLWKG